MSGWSRAAWPVVAVLALAAAADAGSRMTYVIPLKGPVDDALVESFHERAREARRPTKSKGVVNADGDLETHYEHRRAELILVDLQTTGGSLDAALALAAWIRDLENWNVDTVALVHGPGSPATTLLALACDKLLMAADAKLVPLDPAKFVPPAEPKTKARIHKALEKFAKHRPRYLPLFKALVEPSADLQAVEFAQRPGQWEFMTTAEFRKRLAATEEAFTNVSIAKAGSLPTLTAETATRIRLAEGTAATPGAAANQLQIAGKDLQVLGSPKAPRPAAKKAPAEAAPRAIVGEPHAPGEIHDQGPVVFIPLDGMVGKGWRDSVERRVRKAKELGAALLVFEIDTYGGYVKYAFEVSSQLFAIRDTRTVAYVNDKAISAGSIISVACDEIVMHRGSLLGDCQIVTQQGEAVRREKADTVLRADFRKLCEGKYNTALVEAMVNEDYEVYECKKHDGTLEWISGKDHGNLTPAEREQYVSLKKVITDEQLLTMTATEAHKYGFSKLTVNSRDELLDYYRVADRERVTLAWHWSEAFVRWLDVVAPLLLSLGILGIIIELKTPGFGVFGIVGLLLVGVFFYGKYASNLAEVWEILLFFAGVALLAVEIFILPGFGICGVLGLICMVASILLSLQQFVIPAKPFEWEQFNWNVTQLGMVVVGVFVGVFLVSRYLHRTPYFGKLVLAAAPPATAETAVSIAVSPPPSAEAEAERAGELVGKQGVALTKLRPAGRAEIDGEPLDVATEGDFIDAGEPVEIAEVHGNRIIVRRAT